MQPALERLAVILQKAHISGEFKPTDRTDWRLMNGAEDATVSRLTRVLTRLPAERRFEFAVFLCVGESVATDGKVLSRNYSITPITSPATSAAGGGGRRRARAVSAPSEN